MAGLEQRGESGPGQPPGGTLAVVQISGEVKSLHGRDYTQCGSHGGL